MEEEEEMGWKMRWEEVTVLMKWVIRKKFLWQPYAYITLETNISKLTDVFILSCGFGLYTNIYIQDQIRVITVEKNFAGNLFHAKFQFFSTGEWKLGNLKQYRRTSQSRIIRF